MVVDFLRSCYEAPWIDAATETNFRARYYRAFPGAEIAKYAFAYRSAVWLDEWDREEDGDQWPNDADYTKGERPLDTPKIKNLEVLNANGSCDGSRITQTKPGREGLPHYCFDGPGDGFMAYTQAGGSYKLDPTGDPILIEGIFPEIQVPYIGNHSWQTTFPGVVGNYVITVQWSKGRWLVTFQCTLSLIPDHPFVATFDPGDLQGDGTPATGEFIAESPWIDQDPVARVNPTVQWFS